MPHKRNRPAGNQSATTDTALYRQSNAPTSDFDFDRRIVDRVDESISRALFDGHFRLGVRCDVCGRWLTAGVTKRAHCGPRCRAKAVTA